MHSLWLQLGSRRPLADADEDFRRFLTHRERAIPSSASRTWGATMPAGERAADLVAELVDAGAYAATKVRLLHSHFRRHPRQAARRDFPRAARQCLLRATLEEYNLKRSGRAREACMSARRTPAARAKAAKPKAAAAAAGKPAGCSPRRSRRRKEK